MPKYRLAIGAIYTEEFEADDDKDALLYATNMEPPENFLEMAAKAEVVRLIEEDESEDRELQY